MIKNQRQYRITKARIGDFEKALQLDPLSDNAEKELKLLQRAASESLLQSMRLEISEYELLQAGAHNVLVVESLSELPRALIQARIAIGLSQKELADRLGLKEQQVQRYEASDFASASLSTIHRFVDALGVHIREDLLLPKANLSVHSLLNRLKAIGLPHDLVISRMLPRRLRAQIESPNSDSSNELLAIRIAGSIGHIFGLAPLALFGERPVQLGGTAGAIARFKVSGSAEATKLGAYAVYAHYLALVALDGVPHDPIRTMPEKIPLFRQAIIDAYGALTFRNAIQFAWDCGIIVLPLNDSGAFHGACWRVGGRHVVVLKQRTQTTSRWFFDLLHELRHTMQDVDDADFAVIEAEETSLERRQSAIEKDADHFAANVLLDGQAHSLAKQCVAKAKGSVELLKSVVPKVADDANVDVGVLASYLAFRLAQQGVANWWGTAVNLQPYGPNPWEESRDVFLNRFDFGRVNPNDRELLMIALYDSV